MDKAHINVQAEKDISQMVLAQPIEGGWLAGAEKPAPIT